MKKSNYQHPMFIYTCLCLLISGCGSGVTPVENYQNRGDINLVRWNSEHRVKITFLTRDQYAPELRNEALEGFNYWMRGLENNLTFQVLPDNDTDHADIIVGFTDWRTSNPQPSEFLPGWSEILTETGGETFQNSTPSTNGLSQGTGKRLILLFNFRSEQEWYRPRLAAHEMGHALGIRGHSPFIDDLMYTTPNGIGISAPYPSPRDLATLHLALGF